MNIKNFFPIPIGMCSLDRNFTLQETKFFDSLVYNKNMGNLISDDSRVLSSPSLSELRKFIETNLENYFHTVYKPLYKIEPYLTQSWVNKTTTNQFHHEHFHSNSFISGVFYIKADRTHDSISFVNSRQMDFNLKITSSDYNMWNSETWNWETGTGDLLLFPSTLKHFVPIVEKPDHIRISLSFNSFLKGQLSQENLYSLLNL